MHAGLKKKKKDVQRNTKVDSVNQVHDPEIAVRIKEAICNFYSPFIPLGWGLGIQHSSYPNSPSPLLSKPCMPYLLIFNETDAGLSRGWSSFQDHKNSHNPQLFFNLVKF